MCFNFCNLCHVYTREDQFPKRKQRNGSLTLRNQCYSCISLYQKQYRNNHKEYFLNYRKLYYQRNKVRINAQNKNNAHKYREYYRDYAKTWAQSNRLKRAVNESKRRSQKYGSISNYTVDDIKNLLVLQHNKCIACLQQLVKYHIDHRVPLSKGGDNHRRNIDLLCPYCNISKGNKDSMEFMRKNGWLL